LVDRLNQQIMQRVTEYKEKALQALNRNESPYKLRTALQSDERVATDENRQPGDPNRQASPNKQESLSAIGKYQVVKELERIEVSGHKRASRYETFGVPDHSPLR